MPMSASTLKEKYYPSLDGLRGLAIILVFCFHYFDFFPIFRMGWIGIELFFVLSGYLISSRLIPYLNKPGLLKKFFTNRALRILPLYFGFLLVFFGCWFLFTTGSTRAQFTFYSQHGWQFFFFIQNWVYIADPPASANHLQHFWSLAVEEQFYLVYPFMLILFFNAKYFTRSLIILIVLICLSRHLYFMDRINGENYTNAFYNSIFRFDSFLCGVLAYSLKNIVINYKRWIIHFVFITTTLVIAYGLLAHPDIAGQHIYFNLGARTAIPVWFACLLLYCINEKNFVIKKIFEKNWITYIGKISYSLYVIHWPLLIITYAVVNRLTSNFGWASNPTTTYWVTVITAGISSFLLSHLSYKYYESYFLKWKKKMNG